MPLLLKRKVGRLVDVVVLIVETSSTDQYAPTHKFYPTQGSVEEARIRRFYGPDDDKVVYWKLLAR